MVLKMNVLKIIDDSFFGNNYKEVGAGVDKSKVIWGWHGGGVYRTMYAHQQSSSLYIGIC
jgi:phage-related protein